MLCWYAFLIFLILCPILNFRNATVLLFKEINVACKSNDWEVHIEDVSVHHLEHFLQSDNVIRWLSTHHWDYRHKVFCWFCYFFSVLRLDNAPEPYDVNFGNSSYYNSAVSDSSMPEGGESVHDGIPMDDIPPLRTSI